MERDTTLTPFSGSYHVTIFFASVSQAQGIWVNLISDPKTVIVQHPYLLKKGFPPGVISR